MSGLRIAVTGSAGTGKTTLAAALADRLALPLVGEETRAWLEGGGRPLSALAPGEARVVLRDLWRDRVAVERSHAPGFVADGCSLDFAACALHHGCAAAGDPDSQGCSEYRGPSQASEARAARGATTERSQRLREGGRNEAMRRGSLAAATGAVFWTTLADELLAEAAEQVASYDAILVLPWGAIPYQRDGARSPEPSLELRYQLVVEGLLRRHADPARVHALPAGADAPRPRLEWALAVAAKAAAHGAALHAGRVYLVGAGPGDPGLLTVRARELLSDCDVVAYDELVPAALVALAAPRAERLPVGRRCHGKTRDPLKLHPDVLARARAGKSVVRLKAGDPFVFGRGGEEGEELAQAGVAFEVVPGVSAALGAAAAAWIPLTHRELSSDVTFATGHDLTHSAMPGKSDWGKLAGSGTLVLYMASRSLGPNLARLVEHGRAASTPAAWIAAATRPEQQVVVGTLGDLAAQVGEPCGDAPALVVVGEVVALRERLLALAAGGRPP